MNISHYKYNFKVINFLIRYITKIILLISLSLNLTCSKQKIEKITAKKGEMDLRTWNFERDGIIKLDGEWEFYHEEFLDPFEYKQRISSNVLNINSLKNFIQVPGVWNDLEYNNEVKNSNGKQGELKTIKIKGSTYGSYRLILKMNPKVNYVIKVPDQGTAFKLFIDGKLTLKNGEVGKNPENSIPSRENRIIKINTHSENIEILFHVSNFNYNVGGLWSSIFIGSYDDVYDYRDLHLFQDIFLSGLLAIMGFYHIGLYSVRTKERSALYFGLFCLFQSVRSLLINENALYSIVNINFNLGITIEYLTFYLGIPVFGMYLRNIFPREDNRKFSSLLFGVSYFFSLLVVLLPVIYFTKTLITMQIVLLLAILNTIFIIIKSIRKKREGSMIFLLGFTIFSLIMVNDVLHNRYYIETGYFTPLGFSIFIFSQSYLLSVRFSNAFKREEELSMNLELKVLDRTFQLESANKELQLLHKEAESLNLLTKNINTKSDIIEIMNTIYLYLQKEYGYTLVWLICPNKDFLKLRTLYFESNDNSKNYMDYFSKLEIGIEENSCITNCFREKQIQYISNTEINNNIDTEIFEITGWKYLFFLPLVIHNEVIGILSINKSNREEKISSTEREQIQRFVEIIAGTIYSCNLYKETFQAKEIAELAIKDLNKSHAKIIQSEKLVALSQLVSSIAHEINTPIGAIKTSAELMNTVITDVLDKSLKLIHEIEIEDVNKIIKLIKTSTSNYIVINTKEERALRKKITSNMDNKNLPNKSLLTELFVSLRNEKIEEEYFSLWNHTRAVEIIKLIMDFVGLSFKSRVINKSVEKTTKITAALKRLSSGDNDDKKTKQNIIEDIDTVLLVYNNYINQGIEVVRNYEEIPLVECYPDSIHQVWTNIIFNSIQELNKTGIIIITIKKSFLFEQDSKLEAILVTIEDNGKGIPESIKDKIFQPFITTKLAGEGSGLGLYFCKQIIERHRGKIEIESEVGKTKISVYLPIT
jgi:signal transduction histidine kinase